MTHDEAFLQAILEAPEDDTPRLIYADWLEEQGDPRGEFIRLQAQLARMSEDDPHRPGLEDRARLLLEEQSPRWAGSPRDRAAAFAVCRRFMRGDAVPAGAYLDHAAVFRAAPLRAFHLDLTEFEAPVAVIEYFPESVARENLVLPLAMQGGTMTIAMRDPGDQNLVQILQFIMNRDVEAVAAPAAQIAAAIERHYPEGVQAADTTAFMDGPAVLGAAPLPEPGPGVIARLVKLILDEAVALGATAVWLGPLANHAWVRYRIEGLWVERDTPPRRLLRPMVARVRELAGMGEAKRGLIRWRYDGREATLNVRIRERARGPRVVLTAL
jgi:type IV pilus assembly protein PilB